MSDVIVGRFGILDEMRVFRELRISRSFSSLKPLVDELVLMDSDSTDATAEVAAKAGAVVYHTSELVPSIGSFAGGARRCGSRCW